MIVLFVGDLVGRPGRRVTQRLLPRLIDRYEVDYTIVNVENAAGGFGITPGVIDELDGLGIDCFSSGNHIWDQKEGLEVLEARDDVLRPANYPPGNPGTGVHVGETATGARVATVNLEGQVFMKAVDSPFRMADRILEELAGEAEVIVVDFHAEASSEKQALGFYLDGRVAAVLGTHTHVPTADERVLKGGTALLTDVGMTGAYEGVIGFRTDEVLHRFLKQTPSRFEVAKGDVRLAAAVLDIDEGSGRCREVKRLLVSDDAS